MYLTKARLGMGVSITTATLLVFGIAAPVNAAEMPQNNSQITAETASVLEITSDRKAASVAKSDPDKDGRSLVQALAFGSGPAVEEISAIAGFAKIVQLAEENENAAQSQVINQILDRVSSSNPSLFSSVASDLRSGDPFAVKRAFVSISDSVQLAVVETTTTTQRKSAADSVVAPQSLVVVLAVVFHVAAAVTGVVVAAVEAAVVAGGLLWTVNVIWGTSSDAELSDQIVADLTVALD